MLHQFAEHASWRAPRYTSYPPVDRFRAAIGPGRLREWLRGLPPGASVSLYLHVPFCRDICWYCGCETFAARRMEPLLGFVDVLLAEIDLTASIVGRLAATRLVWGGGTPNILPPDLFNRIFERLADRFDLAGLGRHAMELDPRYVTRDGAAAYVARGVRSVSLGVQDLNPHVQQAIGRAQPFALVAAAVETLRAAGIESLGVDLMYGLPLQTEADVETSVEQALRLEPDRVAVFGYDHAPEHRARQRRISAATLPGPHQRLAQAAAMRARLLAAGYEAVGVDHFARPHDPLAAAARLGRLKRDLHGYGPATGEPILGFGPSAISELPQGYAQSADTVGLWRRAVAGGRLATVRGHAFDAADLRRRALIQDLLCRFSADLSEGDGALFDESRLGRLEADGLVRRVGRRLTIPPDARPFARVVAQAFDEAAVGGAPPAV